MKDIAFFVKLWIYINISIGVGCLYGQSVMVNVIVPTNPPPLTYQEVLSFESDVIFQVTNMIADAQEVKFGLSLSNQNSGIYLAIADDYLPKFPISIEGGETRNFSFKNLKAIYGDLNENDIVVEGISYEQIIRAERLPEGDYELCLTVEDYVSGEVLSQDGSCGYFPVLEYEPPIIIYPNNEDIIEPLTPQNLLVQWTPTGLPLKTRYRLQLVNTSNYGYINPLDVFLHTDEVFIYEVDNLNSTSFLYGLNAPPLIEGDTYALRIQAYDRDKELNYLNNGISEPIYFSYQSKTQIEEDFLSVDSDDTSSTATSACVNYTDDIDDQLDPNISAGQVLYVNDFELETSSLVFSSTTNSYGGSGRIYIPFMSTYVDVTFADIKINQGRRVYGESLIYGVTDGSGIVPQDVASSWDSPVDINYTNTFYNTLSTKVSGNENGVNLPFRIPSSDVLVAGFLLRPDQAKLKLHLPLSLPEIVGNNAPYISFSSEEVCINSDGYLSGDVSLTLAADQNLPLINNHMRIILSHEENEVVVNLDGNHSLDLNGTIEFSKSIVAYYNKTDKVRIPFTVQDQSDLDIIIPITDAVDNIVFPGLTDIRIKPESVYLDLSSNENVPGFDDHFPSHTPLWKGMYINEGNIKLPTGLGGNNINVDINGCALSANGLSLAVESNNVIKLASGQLAEWPFSINGFQLTVEEGYITKGEMAGNLRLPIQNGGKMGYTALLSSIENKLDVGINVQPSDKINVDMWLAEMEIYEASTIGLSKVGDIYKITANLHGNLSIDYDLPGSEIGINQLQLPSLDFQNFVVSGIQGQLPQLDMGAVSLDDPDGLELSLQTFTFTMEDWGIHTQDDRHALNFSLGLSLFGGDMIKGEFGGGASTEFDIWARYDDGFKLDEVDLKTIEADLDLGIARADVKIDIFNSDETYGDGFRGEASLALARVAGSFETGFAIQFGKVDGYRYWYFDGRYKSKGGIPLANSGISIYGLGGGGYYNMSASGPAESETKRYNELSQPSPVSYTDPAEKISDFTFKPEKNSRGFRALSIIGSAATSKAWNLESNFLMEWTSGFNITNVSFEGDFNMMRDVDNDDDPPFDLVSNINSTLVINVAREPDDKRVFKGSLDVKVDGQFSSAFVPLSFMYSSTTAGQDRKWYINLGSWSKADPFSDNSRITLQKGPSYSFFEMTLTLKAYLMMGNTFHNGSILPPLPQYITASSAGDDLGNEPQQRDAGEAGYLSGKMDGMTEGMFGIGAGIGLQFTYDLDVLIFYASLNARVVTDFAFTLPQQSCMGVDNMGFNGWFAAGQAYAHLEGAVGVRGKLFGKNINAKLLHLEAGATFQVQFPSPRRIAGSVYVGGSLLNGKIKVKTRRIKFEKGEKCEPVGEFDPLADLEYIGEVLPEHGDEEVDVFINPRIAFNIADNEVLTFDDLDGNTHTYKVSYKVRLKDKTINELVDITDHWSSGNFACRMVPEKWLESEHSYEIGVYIKAYELIAGTWQEIDNKVRKFTFSTAKRPDYIPAQDIIQSYPGLSQRYFMVERDDGNPIRGFVHLHQVDCNDILKDVDTDDPRDGYWAVFTNIRTRKQSSVRCECQSSNRIEWDMPQGLSPEDIYRIELLAKDFEGALAAPDQELEEQWAGISSLQASGISTALAEQKTNVFKDKSTYTSHTKVKHLIDESVGWYAQKSKYRSYGEKLDKFSLDQVAYLPRQIGYNNPVTVPASTDNQQSEITKEFHIPFILLRPNAMTEPFDRYDLIGYKSSIYGVGRVKPILDMDTPINDYNGGFLEMTTDQLGTFKDEPYIDDLTVGWTESRPSGYPYYGEPGTFGILQGFLKNYKKYENQLGAAGYNVNLWRPARKLKWSEISPLISGVQDAAVGKGFSDGTNPTHGGNLDIPLQIYQPSGPITGSTTFASEDGGGGGDIDLEGGNGTLFTNNSFLPIVDWSNLILHKDRVSINKYAVARYSYLTGVNPISSSLYNGALWTLDQRFATINSPDGNYKIKIRYKTGGTYYINYQFVKP